MERKESSSSSADWLKASGADRVPATKGGAPSVFRKDPVSLGASAGWDPHQVWLSRVQQPRNRLAALRAKRAG